MNLARLRWLYFRFRAMSAAEVVHRIGERGRKRADKGRRMSFAARRPVPPAGLERIITLLSQDLLGRLKDQADATRAGEFQALGMRWPPYRGTPNWHLDPVSGREWPRDLFCFDVPYRTEQGMGDVKLVWEINRLQYLVPVAIHAAATGDRELSRLCVQHVLSWIDANPPFRGVNWSSGIELALRSLSIAMVLGLVPSDLIEEDEAGRIGAALDAHLYWLRRYPSRFSSANNHLVAEAVGLTVLALALPDAAESGADFAEGAKTLNIEVLKQILPDGAPAEQSPTYGAFTIELALTAETLALGAGRPLLSAAARERLGTFADFVMGIAGAAGPVPRMGDDDEGRVVSGEVGSTEYVRSIARLVGAFHGDTPVHQTLREAILAPAALPTRKPLASLRKTTFSSGGYTVFRNGTGETASRLVFDHGPLGYLSIAAHGHADALAVLLSRGEREIFVDAGTFLYHSGGKWRRYFRSTAAHNTLTIGGRDQSIQAGAFNWAAKARVRLLDTANAAEACAEQDGYRAEFGVVHTRCVRARPDGSYEVDDRLEGQLKAAFTAEIGFLLAFGLNAEPVAGGWRVTDGSRTIAMVACPEGALRIERGDESADTGPWISPAFGIKEPATRLVARFDAGAMGLTTTISFPAA
jgi:hypothetical protein